MRETEFTLIAEALQNLQEPQKLYACSSWKGICTNKGRGYNPQQMTRYQDINDYFKSDCGNYALKNAFNRANKNKEKTAEMITKLTKGKVECNITEYHIEYIIK